MGQSAAPEREFGLRWSRPLLTFAPPPVGRQLGAVAATANSLADGYPRRTILDAEPEIARAAEALFFEVEFFEDALEAARSRAEARAEALNG